MSPSVSVIVCVRDGEAFITQALDSIASQEVPDIEVVVVDDGSVDNSAAIAASHKLKARVVSQPRLGYGAAMNHGISLAQGRFLAFLDCDDVWTPSRLPEMLAAMASYPDIDGVYGRVTNTDSQLTPVSEPLAARLLGSLLIRRASASRVGDFRTDVTHASNIDWIGRADSLGLRFQAIDSVLLLRRIHDSNLGRRERPSAQGDLLRVIRDHLTRKR